MSQPQIEEKPVAIECRFAMHCPSSNSMDDLHYIKEVYHYADGRTVPHIRMVENYKRPFYLTKKGRRNYNELKEWLPVADLDRYDCTQNRLTESVAKALGQPWFRGTLKDLCKSPYVFGADINSTSIIKHDVAAKYPDVKTPYSVAVFDTETDMLHGTQEIIIASVTCKNHVITCVKRSFAEGISDLQGQVEKAIKRYLGDLFEARKIEFTFKVVDAEIDIVSECMKYAHNLQPDFMAVWNIEFDMDKIVEACAKAKVDVADLLCDPNVPKQYRYFNYKKGPSKKVMASGRTLNFKPSQRWHAIKAASSFVWIDAMQAYRQVRTGAPEEPSYGLDAILKKHDVMGKLKFKEAEKLEGTAQWHVFMQKNYPIEYIVYNIYDCIGMELLDEKTKDLQLSLPMFAEYTDFANFNSLPRKAMNELHWTCQELNMVPGSTASEMTADYDDETTDVKGWIVMLPSHLVADNGLKIIEENPDVRTNIRVAVADLDVTGAYPHNELVFNVSKETTSKELISVEGVDEMTTRMQTINFSGGHVNASEFCQVMYHMPSFPELLRHFTSSDGELVADVPAT